MSSLIFYTDADQIFVATDTLATDFEGSPMLFTSKALYLPHLRMIVAGTGIGGFSGEWAIEINNRMAVSGVLNLNFHTPEHLRLQWKNYKARYSLPDNLTTTVYHFGISEERDEVCSFAYRSDKDFSSEKLAFGTAVKPECALPTSGTLFDALPAMMLDQRKRQQELPPREQLYIGGEIVVMHLTKQGFQSSTAFRFHDYDHNLNSVLQKFDT